MTWLYRIHDAHTGELLYVGVTCDPDRRLTEHAARPWWPERPGLRLTPYASRADAITAEHEAIRYESPSRNRNGKATCQGRRKDGWLCMRWAPPEKAYCPDHQPQGGDPQYDLGLDVSQRPAPLPP